MVIELLKVKVSPHLQEKYLQKDAEIWTTALAKYPGFVSKQVWLNPNDPTEITMVIRWESREQWKAIPVVDLETIDREFTQAMGTVIALLEEREYEVWEMG